jgi:hypothetical protein
MPSDPFAERGGRRAATVGLLLVFCILTLGAGCGKKEGQSPQGVLTVAEFPSGKGAEGARPGSEPVSSRGGFSVFVVPSSPSRIAPPSVSIKSPPKLGAEALLTRWFVNGKESESGPLLSPARFERGDKIRADVKLRAGGEELLLTTPEVVAVNALPGVTDVRLEPQAPTAGSTVRAIVQGQDADGDALKYRYKWYVNDLPAAGESESLALKGVKKGAWIHVSATPNDGFADGAWRESPRYQVVNGPPVVRSQPPATIPPSRILTHTIVADDPDGDPLTYALVSGPAGCSLSGATLTWQVSDADLGRTAQIVIRISDNDGASTILTMILNPQKP